MSDSVRLDVELVRRGLARSRGQARSLVEAGDVSIDGRPAGKVSTPVTAEQHVEVRAEGPRWVSRAAYKLVGALEVFGPLGLQVKGRRCLDVGASTGGFTQVLLHHGAAHVVALDVGHGQLVPELAADPRVSDRSRTTVRDLAAEDIGGPVDLLVADLSFISLTLVLVELRGLVRDDGDAVVLVKPQFEVGRTRLGKGGIVRTQGDRAWAVTEVARAAGEAGLHPRGLARSPIEGGEGNAEYLLWLAPRDAGAMGWEALVKAADEVTAP
ncbi:23S rRNA (cytidine1920-2'-O)/16S rRNA (cytidine1409-2'-O)-methyltransferase [Pedococcus dokdonensis]|uniref:23S rRNA (Cytidine1920-2'-O)/16S rRNA (Cytidine1409-2'-O)-methyltransferase n=1 Tax=Pedococcus dokdonensis TaxID=443156 RepID=A0A1H0PPG8_9MICO|nr:TlyA family RNA methyltransferase [Pedococcus dokdonensis]SDP06700.1 23S rRNA (cytidine1920-2'-O)/16S rRNA (cytidine1409-2'-O)-methyltransferase [Pedococcus dokdonensis]